MPAVMDSPAHISILGALSKAGHVDLNVMLPSCHASVPLQHPCPVCMNLLFCRSDPCRHHCGAHAGPISWEDLVPRFRALRESLLSNNAPLPLSVAALEASSDACLRAQNFAEFLKAAQQLVLVSYPALAADERVGCTQILSSWVIHGRDQNSPLRATPCMLSTVNIW